MQYFFVEHMDTPTCLICTEKVTVRKEYDLKRHYTSRHAEECAKYQGDERAEVCEKPRLLLRSSYNIYYKYNIMHFIHSDKY